MSCRPRERQSTPAYRPGTRRAAAATAASMNGRPRGRAMPGPALVLRAPGGSDSPRETHLFWCEEAPPAPGLRWEIGGDGAVVMDCPACF